MANTAMISKLKDEDFYTLGRIKRHFRVTEHWMLKYVSLGLIRVANKMACAPRYCVSDVERLLNDDYKDAQPAVGRFTAAVPIVGDAR
jgi:hypothetical protein